MVGRTIFVLLLLAAGFLAYIDFTAETPKSCRWTPESTGNNSMGEVDEFAGEIEKICELTFVERDEFDQREDAATSILVIKGINKADVAFSANMSQDEFIRNMENIEYSCHRFPEVRRIGCGKDVLRKGGSYHVSINFDVMPGKISFHSGSSSRQK